MITKEQLIELLKSDETYRIERTTSTTNVDKFQEAICAFANDYWVVTKPSIDFSVSDGKNKKENKSATKNVPKNVLKNVPKNIRKKLSERQVFIYGLIKEDPTISISQMSSKMNVTNKTISRGIENMRSQGIKIIREGSKRGGRWVISDKASTDAR